MVVLLLSVPTNLAAYCSVELFRDGLFESLYVGSK